MKSSNLCLLSPLLAALALVGCSSHRPPAAAVKPPVDVTAAMAAIRAAGEGLDSAVQVQPLRDPAIDGFLAKAQAAEAKHDYAAAIAATEQALKLAPDAPDILQLLAEREVGRSQWLEAEQHAMKSFNLGPKVGSLCARNWQTVVEARLALADEATVAQARERVKSCRVEPRKRM